MYFWLKHVESGPNCWYKFATFLCYHMPLRKIRGFLCWRKRDICFHLKILWRWINVEKCNVFMIKGKLYSKIKLETYKFSWRLTIRMKKMSYLTNYEILYIFIINEKVLVLWENWLSNFSSNLYVSRPPESEKNGLYESVCLSVSCILDEPR